MNATHNPVAAREQKSQVRPFRVAILCDFVEESWPSMDLVGDMLYSHLQSAHAGKIHAKQIRPRMSGLFSNGSKPARLYGRFVQYPGFIAKIRSEYDIFHIVDHSYSQLVHYLPANRTIVTCHDVDTFRSILLPEEEPRSAPFRAMTRRILSGMQKAAQVVCASEATRQSILHHKLVPEERLSVVRNGVHPVFRAEADSASDNELARLLNRTATAVPELLHVGSTIPRKRIDVLLNVFAKVQKQLPEVRLLRVGGAFSAEQEKLAQKLRISKCIDVLPRLEPRLIAAAYRRAACTLMTSEAEGFGLPVIESLACGTPVIASDVPALREVGGSVTRFCRVGDIDEWTQAVASEIATNRDPAAFIGHAANFSWTQYAIAMADLYQQVLAP